MRYGIAPWRRSVRRAGWWDWKHLENNKLSAALVTDILFLLNSDYNLFTVWYKKSAHVTGTEVWSGRKDSSFRIQPSDSLTAFYYKLCDLQIHPKHHLNAHSPLLFIVFCLFVWIAYFYGTYAWKCVHIHIHVCKCAFLSERILSVVSILCYLPGFLKKRNRWILIWIKIQICLYNF